MYIYRVFSSSLLYLAVTIIITAGVPISPFSAGKLSLRHEVMFRIM